MFRKRKPKGSPDGGQFAPDMRGKDVPAASDLDTVLSEAEWDPSWGLKEYAERTDVAFQLYQEQVRNRSGLTASLSGQYGEWAQHACSMCGESMLNHAEKCRMQYRTIGGYIGGSEINVREDDGTIVFGSFPAGENQDHLIRAMKSGRVVEFSVYVNVKEPGSRLQSWREPRVSGSVLMAWSGEMGRRRFLQDGDTDRRMDINISDLQCNCPEYAETYHCKHVDIVLARVLLLPGEEPRRARWLRKWKEGSLFRPDGSPVDEDAAELLVVKGAADAVLWDAEKREKRLAESAAGRVEAAAGWRTDGELLYSGDYEAFREDADAGAARVRAGESIAGVYEYENVLDGACQRGSGQAFGMEIEYDYPQEWSPEYCERVDARIGQQLYAAGLTSSPMKRPYGASHDNFVDTHVDSYGIGTWSWERDGSVAGELVTCAMYDEKDTWDRVETAVGILRRNGADVSVNTGAHVHVGTGGYDAADYTELMRLVGQNEDAFVVLGTNPARRTHRANTYSAPVVDVPPAGFRSVSQLTYAQGGREKLVNLSNCRGETDDHAEFRVFDGSLDASVMQFQVKLAVGMVEAAKRRAAEGGSVRRKETWGLHVAQNKSRVFAADLRPGGEEGSVPVRSLLDTVFRRRADKAKGAAVCGSTEWSKPK